MKSKQAMAAASATRGSTGSAASRRIAHQDERLQGVHELTHAVSWATGLPEIYEAVLGVLERTLGADRVAILLLEPDGAMRFAAWHGLSDACRQIIEGQVPLLTRQARPEPTVIGDLRKDPSRPAFREAVLGEGIGALAFFPLVMRERLLGACMVCFDRPRALDAQGVQLADAIAGQVALALERKRNEERLALYREIFAHSTDAIAIIDTQGRYLEQNAAHRDLIGYADEELAGRTPAVHLGEERFREIAAALMAHGVFREDVTSTTHPGDRVEVELSAFTVRNEAGEPACFVGIKRDITERKRMERALQFLAGASATLDRSLDYDATLRELAALTVPFLADWVVVDMLDEGGRLREVASAHANPERAAALRSLLALRADLEGRPSLARLVIETGRSLPPQPGPSGLQRELGPEAGPLLAEVGGSSAIAVPLRARGRVLGVMTLVSASRAYAESDLSLAEDLARRAAIALDNARLYRDAQESDRRKEEFLAVLAHELRNPLAPIATCLDLMREKRMDEEEAQRWREVMNRQVRNLSRLVDDLLDVSRITRGKIELQKQPVELGALVTRALETARPLLEAQGLALSVSLEPEIRFFGDPLRLEQVFANLLNNAAKYSPSGGQVRIAGRSEGDWVVVQVQDQGLGIAPDMLGRVFELFVQGGRGSGGLGIGLTLARILVELHGGSVRASSVGPGKGSTFEVRLPLEVPGRELAPEPERGQQAAGPHPRRILVVDDNVDAATALAEVLRLRGHEVRVAHDGSSALEEVARDAPDVVLLDIALPDLDGYEIASRLRARPELAGMRLVAVSGYGQEQHRRWSEAAGFACHLVKPIDFARLERALEPDQGGATQPTQ